jgi:hypothetical protein
MTASNTATTNSAVAPPMLAPLPHNTVRLATGGSGDLPSPLASEWILTNGLGGYSMSTAPGINTRRYHGLLVGALTPRSTASSRSTPSPTR